MNIGQAARTSGVSAKMIRYYEQIGLMRAADRTQSNYRSLGPRELNELRFIKRARILGFSVEEIANLLALWRDRTRPDQDVKDIANSHVADLEARIAEMLTMADALRELSACCARGERPDFPILDDLPAGMEPSSLAVTPPSS